MYNIVRDEVFLQNLYKCSKKFYDYNIIQRIPPKTNPELDKVDFAKDVENVKEFVNDSTLDAFVDEYRELDSKIKELNARKTQLSNKLKEAYSEGKQPEHIKNRYTVVSASRTLFDSLKFGNDYPELYSGYLKESVYTTLKLK